MICTPKKNHNNKNWVSNVMCCINTFMCILSCTTTCVRYLQSWIICYRQWFVLAKLTRICIFTYRPFVVSISHNKPKNEIVVQCLKPIFFSSCVSLIYTFQLYNCCSLSLPLIHSHTDTIISLCLIFVGYACLFLFRLVFVWLLVVRLLCLVQSSVRFDCTHSGPVTYYNGNRKIKNVDTTEAIN